MNKLVYVIRTGRMYHVLENTNPTLIGTGYSGQPPYVNDPEATGLRARGPIPAGVYRISHPWDHVRLGPVAMFLDPARSNRMGGRSGFFIHGDNRLMNQTASHGCIILPRKVRDEIATLVQAGTRRLEVTAE